MGQLTGGLGKGEGGRAVDFIYPNLPSVAMVKHCPKSSWRKKGFNWLTVRGHRQALKELKQELEGRLAFDSS